MEIKLATTTEEQILRLKDRGMTIDDEALAREALMDIGYYRLGFYWFPMEKTYPERTGRNHEFKAGSLFETSIHLYVFDKCLRNILANYLSDIEVNVRTKVIYIISNIHKQNPTWFADNDVVMYSYINQFEKKYNNEITNNDVIKRHSERHKNNKYAPAWKTLEYLSFGDLIRLIENIKSSEDKQKIYECYGFNEDKTFPNYIDVIRQLRNCCAHGHPIFDMVLCKSLRAAKFKKVLKGKALPDNFYSNMQGALVVIQYILYYLPGNKGNEFREEIQSFFKEKMTDDIKPMVGYLLDIPWLQTKL
ncbi:MAG: Abi family protein [Paludibacteraceae bacterium]|nr:Abi family protein [Prevotellaceae bacterium]